VKRSEAGTRLVKGWEEGFSPGSMLVLGALTGGYRGLLGTRDWLYARGVLRSRAVDCPVVSIGNLTVGGTGKTPAVELVVRTLIELGHRPAVVSRGYGRQSSGTQVVADTASIRIDADEAGDEPFLLARRLPGVPVVVGANRHEAATLARQRFAATAVVLDDGFQHRTLRKDLEIVMTRARRPWGNGRLLPAGPLREPLTALERADLVVAVGDRTTEIDVAAVEDTIERYAPGTPVLTAAYTPVECVEAERMLPRPLHALSGTRVVAFAGIATPEAFKRTLQELDVDVAEMKKFPDHYWYSADDLRRLEHLADALGADALVTTEKDGVRLRRLPLPRRPLLVVTVRLELLRGDAEWRKAFERVCAKR
jgi:tetraacyldisaccharide 4'-kinase